MYRCNLGILRNNTPLDVQGQANHIVCGFSFLLRSRGVNFRLDAKLRDGKRFNDATSLFIGMIIYNGGGIPMQKCLSTIHHTLSSSFLLLCRSTQRYIELFEFCSVQLAIIGFSWETTLSALLCSSLWVFDTNLELKWMSSNIKGTRFWEFWRCGFGSHYSPILKQI